MAEPHLSSAEPRFGVGFGVPFCLRVSADGWPHGVRVFVAASYRVLNVRGQDPSISGHRTSEFEVHDPKGDSPAQREPKAQWSAHGTKRTCKPR